MAKIAGYQVLHNNDGTNTEVLLFESCCAHCGEAFLAAASVFSPVPEECPRCVWAFELARCCSALAG